jgi:hypothetical protein
LTVEWDITGTIIQLLCAVAEQSQTGMLVVAALLAAPMLPLAALVIKPWRHLAFGVAIFASVLWATCVAFALTGFGRLTWSDRLAFETVVGLLPIAFVWVLGFVALGMFRAGIVASVLWAIGSAVLLFLADVSQPWRDRLVIDAQVGLLPIALAWLLGLVVLGAKRRIMKG